MSAARPGRRGAFRAAAFALVAAAVPVIAACPARAATGWQWPLPPPHSVVHGFAPPAEDWLPGHRGVDLAGRPGERVLAAGDGTVSFAGSIAGIGVVSVTSGDLRTTYQPLHVRVHDGEPVSAGDLLGTLTLAGSHCLPGACLHWGLRRGTTYLDPMALLGLAQVRLLPMHQASGAAATVPAGAAVLALAGFGGLGLRHRRRRPRGTCQSF